MRCRIRPPACFASNADQWQCDLEVPACTRCVRGNKHCSGYRDTSKLRIEDESHEVVRKAERDWAAPRRPSRASSRPLVPSSKVTQFVFVHETGFVSDTSPSCASSEQASPSSITPQLAVSRDELAVNFFINSFVTPGHWNFMAELVSSAPSPDSSIMQIVKACGMANLSNRRPVPFGREWSRLQYASALHSTNEALHSSDLVRKDETLVSVLLLSIFENLSCDSDDSMVSWKAHIDGATQIMKLRGYASLKTKVGRSLFTDLRAQVVINSVWNYVPVPPFIREWTQRLQTEKDVDLTPADTLSALTIDYAELRAAIAAAAYSTLTLYRRVLDCELAFERWVSETKAHRDWYYETTQVGNNANPDDFWQGRVHRYQSPESLGAWNLYRTFRIMLARTKEALWKRVRLDEEQVLFPGEDHRAVKKEMMDDICVSTPCALGHVTYLDHSRSVIARWLVWPLFFAGVCALEIMRERSASDAIVLDLDYNTTSILDEQFSWIVNRLRYVWKDLGIRWAAGVLGVLKSDMTVHADFHRCRYLLCYHGTSCRSQC